jgi:hypothetical protein
MNARVLWRKRRRGTAPLIRTALTVLLALTGGYAFGQMQAAVRIDPIEGILDAFKTHSIVALSEGNHGNEQGHALRLALLRDPRFPVTINDIVVECGNSLYQDVMDRFVRGEDVPYKDLRKVWENTTQAHDVWDRPIYEEFFRAVRDVNASLPKNRQLRVLLGDPPFNWDEVRSREDMAKQPRRTDEFPADLIQREVVAKGRRALVVYGEMHFLRKNVYWPLQDKESAEKRFAAPVNTIVARLGRAGTNVFSISVTTTDLAVLQPSVSSWRAPFLVRLGGNPIGAAPFTFFCECIAYITTDPVKRTEERVQADPQRSPTMQEQFDAVLYMGTPASITQNKLSPALCADTEYMQMRLQRMSLTARDGWDPAANLKSYCAGITK